MLLLTAYLLAANGYWLPAAAVLLFIAVITFALFVFGTAWIAASWGSRR